jgi:hypothetical protein
VGDVGLGLNKNKYISVIRDEFRYVLDSKDDYISDFPRETFRVLKEKEEREFGEYRTRRLFFETRNGLGESLNVFD